MKKISTLVLSLCLAAAFPAAWAQKSVLRFSITYEKMQANGVRLPVIGELVTQAPDINKQYWWSIGCETLDRDYADFDQFKDYFVDLGIGYARLQSGWAKTEKEKGKYDFAWYKGFSSCPVYETITKPYMERQYISDHYPITATLVF